LIWDIHCIYGQNGMYFPVLGNPVGMDIPGAHTYLYLKLISKRVVEILRIHGVKACLA